MKNIVNFYLMTKYLNKKTSLSFFIAFALLEVKIC